MLRERLSDALKVAMKSKDRRATSILRLILAAVKDRDIAARGKGNVGGITDDEVLGVLQTMVRQCEESIVLYNKGERPELAEKEAEEIDVIRRFLPEQLDEEQIAQAVAEAVDELGAANLKDMGRTMALLRENYAGRMDFAAASALVKERLT
jgi:uncharacterized protein YqeY